MVSGRRSIADRGSPGNSSTARSMRGKSCAVSPCIQTFGLHLSDGSAASSGSINSAATMTCLGVTMSMQCASEGPIRLVLSKAATPPTRVIPIQVARYSGRFGINRQTVSSFCRFCRQSPARVAVGALIKLPIGELLAMSEMSAGASPYFTASSAITSGNRRVGCFAICVVIRSERRAPRRKTKSPASCWKNPMPQAKISCRAILRRTGAHFAGLRFWLSRTIKESR